MYKSITRFIQYIFPDEKDFDITVFKKVVFAEFAHAPNGIITVDGCEYLKNDFNTWFEEEDILKRIYFDRIIFGQKELLYFLENENTIDIYIPNLKWEQLKNEEGLVEFISPYFSVSFNKSISRLLNEFDFSNVERLYLYNDYILEEHKEIAYSSLRIFLNDAKRLYRNMNEVSYKDYEETLRKWEQNSWGKLFNTIYYEFEHEIDQLIFEVINFTVRIQKKNPKCCYKLSTHMAMITNLNADLYKTVKNNLGVFESTSGEKKSSNWVGIIIFVAIIFIRLVLMDNDSNTEYDWKYLQPINRNNISIINDSSSDDSKKIIFKYDSILNIYKKLNKMPSTNSITIEEEINDSNNMNQNRDYTNEINVSKNLYKDKYRIQLILDSINRLQDTSKNDKNKELNRRSIENRN